MKVLIDNGHGSNTSGKRSPDGTLREYAYTREIASRIVERLQSLGYDAERIVTETTDVPLYERCKRVNRICRQLGTKNVLLVSVHLNAAGMGDWRSARGWSVHISLNASKRSKRLASLLCAAAENEGLTIRRPMPSQDWWVQNLAMCRDTYCAAVLTENLFQDNKQDVAFLQSEVGKESIVNLHIEGITAYINEINSSK